jgi:hypothetical protein
MAFAADAEAPRSCLTYPLGCLTGDTRRSTSHGLQLETTKETTLESIPSTSTLR